MLSIYEVDTKHGILCDFGTKDKTVMEKLIQNDNYSFLEKFLI